MNELDIEAEKLAKKVAGSDIEQPLFQDWQDPWGKPYSAADAFKNRPPVQHIVSGLFKLPSLNMIYGPPGSMKTIFTLDLCISVAAGLDWLPSLPEEKDLLPFTTITTPTMFLDFDNGLDDMHERIEAIIRGHEIDPDNLPFYYYSFPKGGFIANNEVHIGDLILRIQSYGIQMLWIDNLGIIKGAASENSDEMIPVINNLRHVCEEAKIVIGLVHHQNKSQGFKRRSGESIRGHSSIEAGLNLALQVEREEGQDKINIKPAKVRGNMIYPFSAIFTYEHKPSTYELESAKFFGVPTDQALEDALIDSVIKAELKEGSMNQTKLKKAAKEQLPEIGINRIRGRLERMVAANQLVVSSGPRGSKVYQIV